MRGQSMRIQWVLSAIVATALSGCAAVEGARPDIAAKPLPSRLDEIAYINTLRGVLEPTTRADCFSGAGLKAFKAKLGQGYRESPDPENFLESDKCLLFKPVDVSSGAGKKAMTEYLHAGFGLTDIYCKRFFIVASESQQNRQFARNVNNGVDTLMGTILSLSGAGESAIGITNGVFGLIDGTLEGFDLAYLVGPDMPEVERLVKAEQAVFRSAIFNPNTPKLPQGYGAARATIEAYSGICSFTGMRQLVAKSVTDKTESLNRKASDAAQVSTPSADEPVVDEPGAVKTSVVKKKRVTRDGSGEPKPQPVATKPADDRGSTMVEANVPPI